LPTIKLPELATEHETTISKQIYDGKQYKWDQAIPYVISPSSKTKEDFIDGFDIRKYDTPNSFETMMADYCAYHNLVTAGELPQRYVYTVISDASCGTGMTFFTQLK
jgi:hypothetical protein